MAGSHVTRIEMLPAVWAARLPSAGCVMHLVVCDISFPATMSPSLLGFFPAAGATRFYTPSHTNAQPLICVLVVHSGFMPVLCTL